MTDVTVAEPVREDALAFACGSETLMGVLSRPTAERALAATGVVIVVGGPQYRIGSHRQFVLLARRLAAAGHAVLRFDVRGMGDSGGDQQQSFEDVRDDIAAAVDALQRAEPAVRRAVLWGLCDGASASLLYCGDTGDARIAGLCLLNPWVRTEAGLARAHVKHYYRQRLLQRAFWAKLLRGGIGLQMLGDLRRNLRLVFAGTKPATQQSFQQRMARAWATFDGRILLLLSENDLTAREFGEYADRSPEQGGFAPRADAQRHVIEGADHTVSTAVARERTEALMLQWLATLR